MATKQGMNALFQKHIASSTTELEAKYKGKDMTKDAFTRCIALCKAAKYQETIQPETMDVLVRFNSDVYRISIVGKDAVSYVYKNNKLPDTITIMKKTHIPGVKPIYLEDLGFKLDLKEETNVEPKDVNELTLTFASLEKGYRFKKRYSYLDETSGLRYDLTVVRSSPHVGTNFTAFKNMASAGVLTAQETFEVEIEVMHRMQSTSIPRIINNFLESLEKVYLAIVDELYFINTEDKAKVVTEYLKLCYSPFSINTMKNAMVRPKDYFIGPQPVTLERKNVISPELGVLSIHEGYTVTEKADGERFLMYVSHDGKCYLINNRLTVKYTGVKLNKMVNCLFDGELITTDRTGRKILMFGIFDTYYHNSQDVRGLKLVGDNSRISIANKFSSMCADAFKKCDIVIFTKQFYSDGDIFKLSKTIIDKDESGQFPYKIDGLIYTPKNFAVGAQFENDTTNRTKTWDKVFKWKPPHDNTIDFLVKYDRDDVGKYDLIVKDDKYHKSVTLFVGYNPATHDRLTAKKYLSGHIRTDATYVPKEFIPDDTYDDNICKAYLPLEVAGSLEAKPFPPPESLYKISPKCINGDVIDDNSIVEFAFNETNGSSISQQWLPLRVRKDKTEMLRKFGLSHTANDYNTALNVWRSIQFPVTEDIICGIEKVTKNDIVDDDVYFSSTLDRSKYASIRMKNFHNEYIKKGELIMRMPRGSSLFDVGCGKAGDLKKWIDVGFSKVLGLDVVRDNIENRKNGAYARTIEARKRFGLNTSKTPFAYLTVDCSERITPDYISNLADDDDKEVATLMWGMSSKAKDPQLMRYKNFALGGFDVVSCQFATHYFFENETKLDNFVFNISQYLKKGGYFIGTCLDGQLIKKKLASIKKGQQVQGTLDTRVVWNIKKLYSNNRTIKLGEQIEVFMESIGQPIKEYLVDFNLLQSKLAAKGILPLNSEDCQKMGIERSIENFKATFAKVSTTQPQTTLMREIADMSDVEKEYSFLNTWFIFKKYDI
jgi:hypothetical protein